ncbi:MAG TPA: hypothetical protein VEB66_10730 [Opitutaceae bacterium]|nr:hypothetical protein [Opitutaceae bacterium]
MNHSRKLISLLTGTLALIAVPAFAQSSTTPSGSSSPSDPYRQGSGSTGSMSGAGQQSSATSGAGDISSSTSQSSQQSFTMLDKDTDGRISLSEYTAASKSGTASGSTTGSATGRSSGSGSFGSSTSGGEHSEQQFRLLDTDRDGYLSAAELAAGQSSTGSSSTSNSGLGTSGAGSTGSSATGSTGSSTTPPKDKDR